MGKRNKMSEREREREQTQVLKLCDGSHYQQPYYYYCCYCYLFLVFSTGQKHTVGQPNTNKTRKHELAGPYIFRYWYRALEFMPARCRCCAFAGRAHSHVNTRVTKPYIWKASGRAVDPDGQATPNEQPKRANTRANISSYNVHWRSWNSVYHRHSATAELNFCSQQIEIFEKKKKRNRRIKFFFVSNLNFCCDSAARFRLIFFCSPIKRWTFCWIVKCFFFNFSFKIFFRFCRLKNHHF